MLLFAILADVLPGHVASAAVTSRSLNDLFDICMDKEELICLLDIPDFSAVIQRHVSKIQLMV